MITSNTLSIPISDATSMSPLLKKGDRVLVELGSTSKLMPGEIYLYHQAGEFVVHRFHICFFKGDNSLSPEEEIPQKIFGRVKAIKRGHQCITLTSARSGWPVIKHYPKWAPLRILRFILKIYFQFSLLPNERYSEMSQRPPSHSA